MVVSLVEILAHEGLDDLRLGQTLVPSAGTIHRQQLVAIGVAAVGLPDALRLFVRPQQRVEVSLRELGVQDEQCQLNQISVAGQTGFLECEGLLAHRNQQRHLESERHMDRSKILILLIQKKKNKIK